MKKFTTSGVSAAALTAVTLGAFLSPSFAQSAVEEDSAKVKNRTAFEDTIVVTAGRRPQSILEIARTAIVIGPAEVEENLARSSNINDLVALAIPGFGPPIQNDITRAQSLRGRAAQILIDGVPLDFNGGGGSGLSVFAKFDPEIIGRLEVLYGPNTVYGAGATGGVIQFFTREASKEAFALRFRQQFSTFTGAPNLYDDLALSYKTTVQASGTVNIVDYLFSYSFDSINGQFDAEGDLSNPVFYGFEDEKTYFAKVGINPTPDIRIEGSFNFIELNPDGRVFQSSITDDGRAIGSVDTNQLEFNFGSFNQPINEKEFYNVRYTHNNLLGGELAAQYFGRTEEVIGGFIDLRALAASPTWPTGWPDNYQAFFTDEGEGYRLQYSRAVGERLNLLGGIDYQEQTRGSEAVVFTLDPDFDETRNVSEPNRTDLFLFPFTVETTGLFLQADFKATDRLRFSAGVRNEDVSFEIGSGTRVFETTLDENGVQVARPGGSGENNGIAFNFGASFDATDWLTVYGSFAQGFEIPALSVVAGQTPPDAPLQGDDAVEPQIVDNYEIGFKGAYGIWDYNFAAFFSDSELGTNFLYNPETLAGEYNRAPQENYGFETIVGVEPTDNLRIQGAFSWNDGDFDGDGDGPGGFEPLSGLDVQPYKLTLNVNYDVSERLSLNSVLLNVGDRDRAFDEGIDLYPFEGYTQLDVGASYEVGPGRLNVQLTNVLNEDYVTIGNQTYINNPRFAPRVVGAPGRRINVAYDVTF